MSDHRAFLTFGPAHQCAVEAEAAGHHNETGSAYWTECPPENIGWFLSKVKCISPGCTVDVYYMQASSKNGSIPKPIGDWACRPEIRQRFKGQHYGDCVDPIPKVELKQCQRPPQRPSCSPLHSHSCVSEMLGELV